MTVITAFIFIMFSAVVGYQGAREFDRNLVRACVAEQIDMCADIMCEGDLEFESIISGTGHQIEYCLAHPEHVPPEYFEPAIQDEILKGTMMDRNRE